MLSALILTLSFLFSSFSPSSSSSSSSSSSFSFSSFSFPSSPFLFAKVIQFCTTIVPSIHGPHRHDYFDRYSPPYLPPLKSTPLIYDNPPTITVQTILLTQLVRQEENRTLHYLISYNTTIIIALTP